MWARLRRHLARAESHPEADEALAAADESLRTAESRSTEVRELAADLRHHREVNHFAQRFRESMKGTG